MEPDAPVTDDQETVIAQWQQPARVGTLTARGGVRMLWLIAVPVAAALIALAIWQKELNYGLAAAIILVAIVALQAQNRNSLPEITLTNFRVVIGKREHMISNLAGYWLADEGDVVEVNLETKKPGLIPTTFLFSTPSMDEARTTMSQAMPELEPRIKKPGDQLGNFFKL